MTVELTCIDKERDGEKWQLQIDGSTASLAMPDGTIAATFTSDEAYSSFELLRFAQSGHNVGITIGDSTLHFTAWPKAFRTLKAFVQQSNNASSAPELEKLKRRAWIQTLLGFVLLIGAGILSIDGILLAAGQTAGGEYYVFYGAMIAGALLMFKGWYDFAELRKLKPAAN